MENYDILAAGNPSSVAWMHKTYELVAAAVQELVQDFDDDGLIYLHHLAPVSLYDFLRDLKTDRQWHIEI